MTADRRRAWAKQLLGALPWTAELYQRFLADGHVPPVGYSLERLAGALPGWAEAARRARTPRTSSTGRVLVMGYLKWWLEFACALGVWLSGRLALDVDLGFLPQRRWTQDGDAFDLRRQTANVLKVLTPAADLLRPLDLARGPRRRLPASLTQDLKSLSRLDVQYTLQREDLDPDDPQVVALLGVRLQRNLALAERALPRLGAGGYTAVLIPNGSILEFGALYRVGRHLGLPVVTFEFGEQRERIWLARDAEVMRHDTSDLWVTWKDRPLRPEERKRLEELMHARRGGRAWSNFGRSWQTGKSEGAAAAATALGLDAASRVVLLCTNVVGDSLALGRQVFTQGMAQWLARTVQHLAGRPGVQLIVRVHPGELLGAGHPSEEILQAALPDLGPRVRVVPPDSPINTYDLMELADLGLVYTTTAGLEMAMSGVPVVTAGQTHYRGRGFTLDPVSLADYFAHLDRLGVEQDSLRMSEQQVDLAWRYAYQFFFEFPRPFPWHLLHFWDDMRARPMESILGDPGRDDYLDTLRRLAGLGQAVSAGAGWAQAGRHGN
jgi:hypothetical protein